MRKNDTNTRNINVGKIVWRTCLTLVIVGLYLFITQYFLLCPINLKSVGFWFMCFGLLVILTIILGCYYWHDEEYEDASRWLVLTFKICLILAIACIVIIIVTAIGGSTMFHAGEYSNLIEIQDGSIEEDIPDVMNDRLIVVDQKTAQKLGDRQLAYIPNSTYYEVDNEYNLVSINGEYYRISPVNYGGPVKASKAKGIPAYVQVQAANTGNAQEANVVLFEESMVYSPSAYWSHDLSRHLHFTYPTYMFGKSFFEVSDDGTPYWVTPVETHTIWLFGGSVEKSVVVTNAITGECEEFANSNVPQWIDHVHSVDYLMERISMHYKYRGGWWNAHFGKTDVYATSYDYRSTKKDENEFTPFVGYNSIVGKDGKVYFYTGITPVNNAESNIGFVLVDPRTAEAKFYPAMGAEESSAQAAAEGLVQNLRYSASFPTIVQVNGKIAYFMSLKDNAGLVQRYAICNVENYSKVVEAETIEKAIAKYTGHEMVTTTDSDSDTPEIETRDVQGKVSRVETAEKDGNTYYFFTLESDENVYVSSIGNSSLQPMKLANGANVALTCYDSTEEGIVIVTVISFK